MIELEMEAGVTMTYEEFCYNLFSVLPEEYREEVKKHQKKLRKGDVDQLVMQEALDELSQAHRDYICKLICGQGARIPEEEIDQPLAAAAEMDPDVEGAYDTHLDRSQAAPTVSRGNGATGNQADYNANQCGPSGASHGGYNQGNGGTGCGNYGQGNNGTGCGNCNQGGGPGPSRGSHNQGNNGSNYNGNNDSGQWSGLHPHCTLPF